MVWNGRFEVGLRTWKVERKSGAEGELPHPTSLALKPFFLNLEFGSIFSFDDG